MDGMELVEEKSDNTFVPAPEFLNTADCTFGKLHFQPLFSDQG